MLGIPVTELFSIKVNVLFCFAKKNKQTNKKRNRATDLSFQNQ